MGSVFNLAVAILLQTLRTDNFPPAALHFLDALRHVVAAVDLGIILHQVSNLSLHIAVRLADRAIQVRMLVKALVRRDGKGVDVEINRELPSLFECFCKDEVDEEPVTVGSCEAQFGVPIITPKAPRLAPTGELVKIKTVPQAKIDILWGSMLRVNIATNDPVSDETSDHFASAHREGFSCPNRHKLDA